MSPFRGPEMRQHMSFFGGPGEGGVRRIDKSAMKEIIDDVENSSREESGYCVIDVRGQDEVAFTGKLSEVVNTLPLPHEDAVDNAELAR